MAIRYYDEAIVAKIQSWIRDPNLKILKPEESKRLFSLRADQVNDNPITLPLISLSREPNIKIDYSKKRNLTFDGLTVAQSDTGKSIQLNAIPITVTYQLDIYTKRYEEGDEYLRNFTFQLINNPTLSVIFPYNGANIEHIAYLNLNPTLTDNSDIPEKLFSDQFTRWTIGLELSNAYLISIPFNQNCVVEDGSLDVITEINKNENLVEEEKVD